MILIERITDEEIMHDQLPSGWAQQDKLDAAILKLQGLPSNTAPNVKAQHEQEVEKLQAEKQHWIDLRLDAICKMFGGIPSGYRIIEVPEEEKIMASTARYIEKIDGSLVYYNGPEYSIVNSSLVVNPGWVKGNYRLIDSDVTDFSSLTLVEPLYFALVYAQSNVTEAISVQLLTRAEDEEFDTLPPNLTKIRVICEGRVNLDNSITLSEVV